MCDNATTCPFFHCHFHYLVAYFTQVQLLLEWGKQKSPKLFVKIMFIYFSLTKNIFQTTLKVVFLG